MLHKESEVEFIVSLQAFCSIILKLFLKPNVPKSFTRSLCYTKVINEILGISLLDLISQLSPLGHICKEW